jgi:DNA-binding transcriptional ArsR family regulator
MFVKMYKRILMEHLSPDDRQDRVFKALADPTRRTILALLGAESRTVSDLTARFDMSQPAVSQHLRVLRDCGLVSEHAEGRRRVYALEAAALAEARDWLDRNILFWTSRLENLGDHLRKKHGPKA